MASRKLGVEKRLMHNVCSGVSVHKNFLDVRHSPKTTKQCAIYCVYIRIVLTQCSIKCCFNNAFGITSTNLKLKQKEKDELKRRFSKYIYTNRHRFCFGFHKRLTLCFTASILVMGQQYTIE